MDRRQETRGTWWECVRPVEGAFRSPSPFSVARPLKTRRCGLLSRSTDRFSVSRSRSARRKQRCALQEAEPGPTWHALPLHLRSHGLRPSFLPASCSKPRRACAANTMFTLRRISTVILGWWVTNDRWRWRTPRIFLLDYRDFLRSEGRRT